MIRAGQVLACLKELAIQMLLFETGKGMRRRGYVSTGAMFIQVYPDLGVPVPV